VIGSLEKKIAKLYLPGMGELLGEKTLM